MRPFDASAEPPRAFTRVWSSAGERFSFRMKDNMDSLPSGAIAPWKPPEQAKPRSGYSNPIASGSLSQNDIGATLYRARSIRAGQY